MRNRKAAAAAVVAGESASGRAAVETQTTPRESTFDNGAYLGLPTQRPTTAPQIAIPSPVLGALLLLPDHHP